VRPGAPHRPILGAYVGGAATARRALPAWERWSGVKSPYALDFTATSSWDDLVGPKWMLAAWRGWGRRLVYSVPMFPGPKDRSFGGGVSLEECAAGSYDGHWKALGRNLATYHLEDTIVRPGWEFNGDWFGWAAKGHEQAYVGCFQHLVRTMRAVPGQRFAFVWNPNVGQGQFPAEQAYPGDNYVDYIGLDLYDSAWLSGSYPTAAERAAAARKSWHERLAGDHGLSFWAGFGHDHGKPLAFPEWGLALGPDGNGGGDNPYFIEQMIRYLHDPANNVAFAMYFDVDDGGRSFHRLSNSDTRFPRSASRYRQLMATG
jgi:Glycosyl hydrolase family 26